MRWWALLLVFLLDCPATRAAPAGIDWLDLPPIAGWSGRVRGAQAATDAASRRDLMVGLVRDALKGSGHELHVAGVSSPREVMPEDYRPLPAINFDVNLNSKTSRRFTEATVVRSLAGNAGYQFSHQGVPYVVLGPIALNPHGPEFLRMYADHELFHVDHHAGDRRAFADRELEAWVYQFRRWFFRLRERQQKWKPMLEYFDQASAAEQREALDALIGYYRQPPAELVSAEDLKTMQSGFRRWLATRGRDAETRTLPMVKALDAAIRQQ